MILWVSRMALAPDFSNDLLSGADAARLTRGSASLFTAAAFAVIFRNFRISSKTSQNLKQDPLTLFCRMEYVPAAHLSGIGRPACATSSFPFPVQKPLPRRNLVHIAYTLICLR